MPPWYTCMHHSYGAVHNTYDNKEGSLICLVTDCQVEGTKTLPHVKLQRHLARAVLSGNEVLLDCKMVLHLPATAARAIARRPAAKDCLDYCGVFERC